MYLLQACSNLLGVWGVFYQDLATLMGHNFFFLWFYSTARKIDTLVNIHLTHFNIQLNVYYMLWLLVHVCSILLSSLLLKSIKNYFSLGKMEQNIHDSSCTALQLFFKCHLYFIFTVMCFTNCSDFFSGTKKEMFWIMQPVKRKSCRFGKSRRRGNVWIHFCGTEVQQTECIIIMHCQHHSPF